MTTQWVNQKERGHPWLVALAVKAVLRLGRRFGMVVAWGCGLYFCLFSGGTRVHSSSYLRRVLGREPGFRDRFRHYRHFSVNIVDRLFFITNQLDRFDITVHGREHIERYLEADQSCILLGAHYGSFESLRAMGAYYRQVPVKGLYQAENSERFDALLESLNPDAKDQLIHLGRPGAMLEAHQFLESGGLVGILGDRSFGTGPAVSAPFLGSPAPFPVWPFRLAAATGKPVVLFFGVFVGGRRYEIHFEAFADRIERAEIADPAALTDRVRAFASRLEEHCRRQPWNWFNFFDFWADHESLTDSRAGRRADPGRDRPDRAGHRRYAQGPAGTADQGGRRPH